MNAKTPFFQARTACILCFLLWTVCWAAAGCSSSECTYDTDCPGLQTCIDGQCVAVSNDCPDRDCPDGFVCLDDNCIEAACISIDCPEGSACADGACYPEDCSTRSCPGYGELCIDGYCLPASCVDVQCPEGERCASGACYPIDCESEACPGYGEVCVQGQCVERSCVGVTCPEDYACAGGQCYPLDCGGDVCEDERQVCVDGQCTARTCAHVECPEGELCADGWCLPASCSTHGCQEGEVCVDEVCVDAECVHVACDAPPSDYCDGDVQVRFPAEGICIQGVCEYAEERMDCPGGCQSGRCVDVTCGGVICDPGEDCVDEECRCGGVGPDCGAGETCCGSACVRLDSDPAHCGRCNHSCGQHTHCSSSSCHCDGGWGECSGGWGDGCETPLGTLENCLGCGDRCGGGGQCAQAVCTPEGCDLNPVADGTACGNRFCDGKQLRQETCQGGSCAGSALVEDCDDGEFCTDDFCDADEGCSHAEWTDGTECGSRYCDGLIWRMHTCQGGTCSGSSQLADCEDPEYCIQDHCLGDTGCENPPMPDYTPCPTEGWYCLDGESVEAVCGNDDLEPWESCDDGNNDDEDECSPDCQVGCSGGRTFQGHCYRLVHTGSGWSGGHSACLALGMDYAAVSSSGEMSFLVRFRDETENNRYLWLGLHYDEGAAAFVWTNGETVTYTNWASGEPNDNSCCAVYRQSSYWYDNPCEQGYVPACESD
ncbi:MAG: hypothetical protein JXR96_29305 [Deltaproteobacteria bacterium]|nr:hypothetical protein [Deltaproteobacteria bacterium]